MLFDVIKKLNDEIRGMIPRSPPRIFGMTDGNVVQITFMDKVVWDSSDWLEDGDTKYHFGDEAKVAHELSCIEAHIKRKVSEHLMELFEIQW